MNIKQPKKYARQNRILGTLRQNVLLKMFYWYLSCIAFYKLFCCMLKDVNFAFAAQNKFEGK